MLLGRSAVFAHVHVACMYVHVELLKTMASTSSSSMPFDSYAWSDSYTGGEMAIQVIENSQATVAYSGHLNKKKGASTYYFPRITL